ncbi:hypothetical protein KY309_01020 [Candidatus Woesearchaeota archaeon]|nr:hypothetical protein [Candidatus Woesearchaeota archaeon]
MECQKEKNLKNCGCTYPGCPNKGICCQCIREHRERGELPGCLFPKEVEQTFDRSIKAFVNAHKELIE